MEEKNGDLADGVKRIKGEVKKVSKSTALAIAAAIGVVAALALNEAMKALFASLFSPGTTLVAQFGYAIFVIVVAALVGNWAKKHEDSPASSG